MTEWITEDEKRERRRRISATTLDQRLAWLDDVLALAQKTGALDRARKKKWAQADKESHE